jgi:ABC-2 type transport system permease protein
MRALFHGHAGDPSIWHSLTMMLALAVLALVWSARQFARSVR